MSIVKGTARLAAVVVVTLLGLELVARLTFGMFTGSPYDAEAMASRRIDRLAHIAARTEAATSDEQDEQDEEAIGADDPARALLLRLHPYLGFVGRAGARPWSSVDTSYNEFGMLTTAGFDYPYHKSGNEFVVGVFGGSVAEGFANLGAEELSRALREISPVLNGAPVVVLPLALGGYKQPQQLILLEYALLSGFELDAVVNLDGYNEVVLAAENANEGIDPVGPSGGHYELLAHLEMDGLDPTAEALVSAIAAAQGRERAVLEIAQARPLSSSAFAGLVAELWSRSVASRVQELNRMLLARARDGELPGRGEPQNPQSERRSTAAAESLADAVRVWSLASEMMGAVCELHGLVYVHALQPNQYVEGSKPLTAGEKETAFSPDNPWSIWAAGGYPLLREEGEALRERGVPFYDTTLVFEEVTSDLYTDDCCHFNRRGNEILARSIARALAAELEAR